MVREPQKAPLPCFGKEYQETDARCYHCPHQKLCCEYMGAQLNRVPLDQITFNLMPEPSENGRVDLHRDFLKYKLSEDDPDAKNIQFLYERCYKVVFNRMPTDSAEQHRLKIQANAKEANCSLEAFLLSNMVAHQNHDSIVNKNTQTRVASFRAHLLTGALSIKRAHAYLSICRKRFGTFSTNSLLSLSDAPRRDTLENTMLNSETTFATNLINTKMVTSTPTELQLYEAVELQLAPEWLALEATYFDYILKLSAAGQLKAAGVLARHRHDVIQMHGAYKRSRALCRQAFISRQEIMPEAVNRVLSHFGYAPTDFLFFRDPVTNVYKFWLLLALAIRHHHCLRFLEGETSCYRTRLHATGLQRS